jgi:hypothetical protein
MLSQELKKKIFYTAHTHVLLATAALLIRRKAACYRARLSINGWL